MKKNLIIILIIGVLTTSTGVLAVLHFQDVAAVAQTNAHLAKVEETVATLQNDMATMRELAPGRPALR